jgi:uncharacterized membrane protein
MWWHRALVYGAVGVLIEMLFTGIYSVIIDRNPRAIATSYLWMIPIYGLAGLILETLNRVLYSVWLFAPAMVIFIYAYEFVWGWVLERLAGKKIWDYGRGKHTIMGYVNFRYLPFWLLLACFFGPMSRFLTKLVQIAGRTL